MRRGSPLAAGIGSSGEELQALLKMLAPRWFLTRDVHAAEPMSLLKPRWAMSLLRGPMTRAEIRRARARVAFAPGRG